MTYGDFKDLKIRTAADKVLLVKVFNVAENRKFNGYQRGLDSMVYKFFDKKTLVEQLKIKLCLIKIYQKNYTDQLLKYLRKEKYTHLLKTIFGTLI